MQNGGKREAKRDQIRARARDIFKQGKSTGGAYLAFLDWRNSAAEIFIYCPVLTGAEKTQSGAAQARASHIVYVVNREQKMNQNE